jgi:hypothetical protein
MELRSNSSIRDRCAAAATPRQNQGRPTRLGERPRPPQKELLTNQLGATGWWVAPRQCGGRRRVTYGMCAASGIAGCGRRAHRHRGSRRDRQPASRRGRSLHDPCRRAQLLLMQPPLQLQGRLPLTPAFAPICRYPPPTPPQTPLSSSYFFRVPRDRPADAEGAAGDEEGGGRRFLYWWAASSSGCTFPCGRFT